MPKDVDRPTAVANALAAAVTDTFEEKHPGPALFQHQNTARNRVRRDVKQDRWRNAWLQRIYDGSFFVATKVCEAVGRYVDSVTLRSPIRPYNGGELKSQAVSYAVADISSLICIISCAISDAVVAYCERSELSQPSDAEKMDQPEPKPSVAPIGPPIAQSKPRDSPQPEPTPSVAPIGPPIAPAPIGPPIAPAATVG